RSSRGPLGRRFPGPFLSRGSCRRPLGAPDELRPSKRTPTTPRVPAMKLQHATLPFGTLLAGLTFGPLAAAQAPRVLFSVDYHGPTIALPDCTGGVPITEGELLSPCTAGGTPAFGPLATPRTSITGGAGGLNLALH